MKHSILFGLVVALTVLSFRSVTPRAYAVGSTWHKSAQRGQQAFKGSVEKLVSKTGRAVGRGEEIEQKNTLSATAGLMVGMSLLGAVPQNAHATQIQKDGPILSKLLDSIGSSGGGPASGPASAQTQKDAPILNKVFGNIGSQAAVATPYLKAKPDPSPAAPFQDRNPRAFLDTDRSIVNKDEMNDRKRANQRPGKRTPLLDNDFREAYATFFHDSN